MQNFVQCFAIYGQTLHAILFDSIVVQNVVQEFVGQKCNTGNVGNTYVTQDRRGHPDYRAVQLISEDSDLYRPFK